MAIDITAENARILEDAVKIGHFKDRQEALAAAFQLLKDKTAGENGVVLSPEKWREKFEQHLAATPANSAAVVDDSRESIYEGRRE